jgi:hypothetical protein
MTLYQLFSAYKSHKYFCFLTLWFISVRFRAHFCQNNFLKKLNRKSGSGFGRFQKSDPDPVKYHLAPQHCDNIVVMLVHDKNVNYIFSPFDQLIGKDDRPLQAEMEGCRRAGPGVQAG